MAKLVAACKRVGLAGAFAAMAAMVAPEAFAHTYNPSLATLEVFDRAEGTIMPVYEKDGRRYIVGTPGHEYAVRIRNNSAGRILAVTSVDGVNVVTGDTAAPDQSGYVIGAYDSVEISGWRKGFDRTAAFYFTDLGDSYAARTGRPRNVGVIGVALFRERERPIAVYPQQRERSAEQESRGGAMAERRESNAALPAPPSSEPLDANAMEKQQAASPEARDSVAGNAGSVAGSAASRSLASRLGTGHGRSETSYAQQVRFERASTNPSEALSIQYDRRDNLIALGVLPEPRIARRAPDPFPGSMRFVPDPR